MKTNANKTLLIYISFSYLIAVSHILIFSSRLYHYVNSYTDKSDVSECLGLT